MSEYVTIELEEQNMKGHKLFCDLVYLGGELAGCPGCRWAVVVGYDISMFHMDCYGFTVKPTKRQLRSLKRKYR